MINKIKFILFFLGCLQGNFPFAATIAAGNGHKVFLDEDGHVWTLGPNEDGQLGLGNTINQKKPQMIPNIADIRAVAAGDGFTVLLDNNGRVWTFGDHSFGQLGLGNGLNRYETPQMIPNLTNVKAVAAIGSSTVLLDENGHVWTFGLNNRGQLGLGNNSNQNTPQMIPNLTNIKAVAATGSYHTVLLDENGHVWTFGLNNRGQLGLGNNINQNTPQMIPNIANIKAVAAGDGFTVLLDNNGRVWTFGDGFNGQLGLGNNTHQDTPQMIPDIANIKAVATGGNLEYFTLLLAQDGHVYTFGEGINTPQLLNTPFVVRVEIERSGVKSARK